MPIDIINYPSPEAAEATVVYAVADIHGRLDLLLAMESLIARDIADTQPSCAVAVVCYLGDYIDRGLQSAQVIDHLSTSTSMSTSASAASGRTGTNGSPARVFLKGNHEDRMLAFLSDPEANGPGWLDYGGREALASYGLGVSMNDEADTDAADWLRLRDELNRKVPPAHLQFLHALRLAFVWRDYIFVHAGLNPARPLDAQDAHDLMWIREPFLKSSHLWSHRIVHGHVVVSEPQFHANRIAIDTGASRTGRLTALVVSEAEAAPRLLQVTR
jgi:serine/threonine protein phosphatase 1